eukprot:g1587.t1
MKKELQDTEVTVCSCDSTDTSKRSRTILSLKNNLSSPNEQSDGDNLSDILENIEDVEKQYYDEKKASASPFASQNANTNMMNSKLNNHTGTKRKIGTMVPFSSHVVIRSPSLKRQKRIKTNSNEVAHNLQLAVQESEEHSEEHSRTVFDEYCSGTATQLDEDWGGSTQTCSEFVQSTSPESNHEGVSLVKHEVKDEKNHPSASSLPLFFSGDSRHANCVKMKFSSFLDLCKVIKVHPNSTTVNIAKQPTKTDTLINPARTDSALKPAEPGLPPNRTTTESTPLEPTMKAVVEKPKFSIHGMAFYLAQLPLLEQPFFDGVYKQIHERLKKVLNILLGGEHILKKFHLDRECTVKEKTLSEQKVTPIKQKVTNIEQKITNIEQKVTIPILAANLWLSPDNNNLQTESSCHFDAHRNLLCVIKGKKTVLLYKPGTPPKSKHLVHITETHRMNHTLQQGMPNPSPSIHQSDVTTPKPTSDGSARPSASSDSRDNQEEVCVVAEVCAGDYLYIPEGWYHQVVSDPNTVALNIWLPGFVDTVLSRVQKTCPLKFQSGLLAFVGRALLAESLSSCSTKVKRQDFLQAMLGLSSEDDYLSC